MKMLLPEVAAHKTMSFLERIKDCTSNNTLGLLHHNLSDASLTYADNADLPMFQLIDFILQRLTR